jgi:hypothetical protein
LIERASRLMVYIETMDAALVQRLRPLQGEVREFQLVEDVGRATAD